MRTQKNTHKRDIKMLNRKYTCYLKPTASYQSYDETPEEFPLKTEHDYLLTSFRNHIYNKFKNIIKFSLTITKRNSRDWWNTGISVGGKIMTFSLGRNEKVMQKDTPWWSEPEL